MGYFSEEESYEEDYDAYDEPVDEEEMDEE